MHCALWAVFSTDDGDRRLPLSDGANRRRGVSLLAILASLLIVALATVSVASTLVALRALKERDHARDDYAGATRVIDQYIMTIANNSKLKGTSMEPLRNDLYQPAFDYFQQYVQAHANDKDAQPQLANAHYHLAGLLAKRGSKDAMGSINNAIGIINAMKMQKADAASYPSLYQCAFRYTLPTEWFTFKGLNRDDMRSILAPMVITMDGAVLTYEELKKAHPEATQFREDIAGIARIKGTLFGFANANERAATEWQRAADNLDSLVKEHPSELDYKIRLAEALAAVASRQKSMRKNEEAMANLERVIALREEIVTANPDDANRKSELTTAKRDLERLQKAKPAKPEEPPADAAASAAPEAAAAPAPADGQ